MMQKLTLSDSLAIPLPTKPNPDPEYIFSVEKELLELAGPLAYYKKKDRNGYHLIYKEVVEGDVYKCMRAKLWKTITDRFKDNSKGATELVQYSLSCVVRFWTYEHYLNRSRTIFF